jgi:hypothetical protein
MAQNVAIKLESTEGEYYVQQISHQCRTDCITNFFNGLQ